MQPNRPLGWDLERGRDGSMVEAKKTAPSARRHEIVEIATGLFLENGFAATSMATVAEAAGLTKASLYHHFPGKEELFAACVTHGYAAELERLRDIASGDASDAPEKMQAAINALYETIISSQVGRMSPLIAEVSRSFPTVARSFHDDYIGPQHEILCKMIDEGVASGQFADVDRKVFLHLVFGPIVTLSLSREMFATFQDLEEHFPVAHLRDGHVEMLMQALAKPLAV